MNRVILTVNSGSVNAVDATHYSLNYSGLLIDSGGGQSGVSGTITLHVDTGPDAIHAAIAADARAFCLTHFSITIETNELVILNPWQARAF
jgi:hypothetical protein